MKKNKKIISLRWKLLAYTSVFMVGLLILIFVFQIYLLEPFYNESKIDNVKNTANDLALTLGTDNFESYVNDVSRQNDLCIRVVYSNGNQPSDIQASNTMGCALQRLTPEEMLDYSQLAINNDGSYLLETNDASMVFVNNGAGQGTFEKRDNGNKTIIYTLVKQDEENVAIIFVSANLSPLNATIDTLKTQIVYIMIIVILATLLLVWFLYRKIAKPISAINTAANNLPNGSYQSTNANDYEEVKELDLTLTNANDEIKKADKAKRDLIANVSHDLRTPLTMISGYGEMMRDLPNEKTDENVQVIIDESQRLTTLVNDLLDLSKLQENKITLNLETTNITQLLKKIINNYNYYVVHDNFDISLDYGEEVDGVIDTNRISQVLNNFINNAINYSGDNKKIIVKQSVKDNTIKIEVIDHGKGIKEEDLPLVWDRYFKVDKTHVRPTSGSGIGLSIVKEILELHHFKYGVTSHVDEGSDFWFEIPLSSNNQSKQPS